MGCILSQLVLPGQEALAALFLFGRGNLSMGEDGWMPGVMSLMRSPSDGVSSGCASSQLGCLCPRMPPRLCWERCAAPSHCASESTGARVFTAEYPRSNSA